MSGVVVTEKHPRRMSAERARTVVLEMLRDYTSARTQPERDRTHERYVLTRHAFLHTYGRARWRLALDFARAELGLNPTELDRCAYAPS